MRTAARRRASAGPAAPGGPCDRPRSGPRAWLPLLSLQPQGTPKTVLLCVLFSHSQHSMQGFAMVASGQGVQRLGPLVSTQPLPTDARPQHVGALLAGSPEGGPSCFLPIRCVRNAGWLLVVILTFISRMASELGDGFVSTGLAIFLSSLHGPLCSHGAFFLLAADHPHIFRLLSFI